MRAIFIDRDGVINKDPGGWTEHSYVTDPKDLHILPGVIDALKLLDRNNIKVIVISNQAGVSKGYFTKEMLMRVTSKMLDEIGKKGARIEEVIYCMHRNEDNCNCRKPKTGMLEKAIDKYNISVRETFFVGDSEVDIIAGKRMGLKTVFVQSGKATKDDVKKWQGKPDYVFNDLLSAVKWMLTKAKRRNDRAFKRTKNEGVREDGKVDPDSVCDSGDRA
ncbi:MAG: HAD family hydrolase [Candidatus Omnitrophota bacterium]